MAHGHIATYVSRGPWGIGRLQTTASHAVCRQMLEGMRKKYVLTPGESRWVGIRLSQPVDLLGERPGKELHLPLWPVPGALPTLHQRKTLLREELMVDAFPSDMLLQWTVGTHCSPMSGAMLSGRFGPTLRSDHTLSLTLLYF